MSDYKYMGGLESKGIPMKEELTVELVATLMCQSSWGYRDLGVKRSSNFSPRTEANIPKSEWDKLRKSSYKKANYFNFVTTYEICGG